MVRRMNSEHGSKFIAIVHVGREVFVPGAEDETPSFLAHSAVLTCSTETPRLLPNAERKRGSGGDTSLYVLIP
jgi:hypothetical protein